MASPVSHAAARADLSQRQFERIEPLQADRERGRAQPGDRRGQDEWIGLQRALSAVANAVADGTLADRRRNPGAEDGAANPDGDAEIDHDLGAHSASRTAGSA